MVDSVFSMLPLPPGAQYKMHAARQTSSDSLAEYFQQDEEADL
jgi:hypothetical protein